MNIHRSIEEYDAMDVILHLFKPLLLLQRREKQWVMLIYDAFLIVFSYYSAYALRLGSFIYPFKIGIEWWLTMAVVTLGSLFIFLRIGLYRAIVHYMSSQAVRCIAVALVGSSLLLGGAAWVLGSKTPRSVPFIYLGLLVLFVGGGRMFVRGLYEKALRSGGIPRVLIYGAGECGAQLANILQTSNRFQPVAFIDDAKEVQGTVIRGLRVYAQSEIAQLRERHHIEKVLLAIPSASHSRRNAVLKSLCGAGLGVMTVPSLADVAAGKAGRFFIEDVRVSDLLGRDLVQPIAELLYKTTQGKSVLVTGAGGSIGSELCRQIAAHFPKRLVLYELSEASLYKIDQELRFSLGNRVEIIPCLGNVQDKTHLERQLRVFGVQTVYHAAAYKHVPMVEYNVIAGVKNNIFGTLHAAQAAMAAGVERFVLISTDKAVRPTNVMGATKRVCELLLQYYAAKQQKTCFSMVRFGNVLGSSGSVIPLFRRQIAEGGPVTVTHPEVTRFFMTIPEAVQLVLQASGMARGGEVFVLDMGKAVRILDMARLLINLNGKSVRDEEHPDGDIEIKITGLRPGEKLYEELLVNRDTVPTSHPRIMSQMESCVPEEQLLDRLAVLDAACVRQDVQAILAVLSTPETGFVMQKNSDIFWNACHPDSPAVFQHVS